MKKFNYLQIIFYSIVFILAFRLMPVDKVELIYQDLGIEHNAEN
tara:strand:+ start:1238 stop:1369 length:132 start_codon:yes stop_codon:yes gene_type:complete